MKRRVSAFAYQHLLKPVLFQFPADDVHDRAIRLGERLGQRSFLRQTVQHAFVYKNDPFLAQTISGIRFPNPIGLSAGFDYDARLLGIIPSVGFGFHTVGTVTARPYAGNTRPMLGRLPKSRSLLVNKGFKNAGIDVVSARCVGMQKQIPLGMSLGQTNRSYDSFEESVADVAHAFLKAMTVSTLDYLELNISCPNLVNVQGLNMRIDEPEGFVCVLEALAPLSLVVPVFVKLPAEIAFDTADQLMELAKPYTFIAGFICSNLVKDRSNISFDPEEIARAGKGNFSGKPTERASNRLLRHAYLQYRDRYRFVGCGGVFTAEDAYRKIRLGASLVQMITGLVFCGPQVVGEINAGLVRLLRRDGFTHISEAVGVGVAAS